MVAFDLILKKNKTIQFSFYRDFEQILSTGKYMDKTAFLRASKNEEERMLNKAKAGLKFDGPGEGGKNMIRGISNCDHIIAQMF